MIATTDQKAHMFDLVTAVMGLVRDGNRNVSDVCRVLQVINDDPNFMEQLLAKDDVFPADPNAHLGLESF